MTHDSLCGLSQPCDDEVPEHGYCSRQEDQFCIHCMTWCICWQVRYAEQIMLAKCIAAVQDRIRPTLHPLENAGIGEAIAALRALQDKP